MELYRGRDQLMRVRDGQICLRTLGLLPARQRVDERQLEGVRAVRSAVRSYFIAGDGRAEPTLPPLALGVVLSGERDITISSAAAGMWGRLAAMLVEMHVAHRTGDLARLKACANPACRWLFWDTSRPGTGKWCSMRVCGGQLKARRYRSRLRQSTT